MHDAPAGVTCGACYDGDVIPSTLLGTAVTPDGTQVTLLQRGGDYTILADGKPLMTSRLHGSEEMLATFGAEPATVLDAPVVLVGGLGMGFTLRALLDVLPPLGQVVVAELLPEVVEWNRKFLGGLAGSPLDDPRVRVEVSDVSLVLSGSRAAFDAVLLDVDNGPDAFAETGNSSLYGDSGLAYAKRALRPHGAYAVWSAYTDRRFEARLERHGFAVETRAVRARGKGRGAHHTICRGTLR